MDCRSTAQVRQTEVTAVTYHENASRTVSVVCPFCGQVEEWPWPITHHEGSGYLQCLGVPDAVARCGGGTYRVSIPVWAYDVRYRTGFRRKFLQANPVFAGGDFGRDDQAQDVPVANWTE